LIKLYNKILLFTFFLIILENTKKKLEYIFYLFIKCIYYIIVTNPIEYEALVIEVYLIEL